MDMERNSWITHEFQTEFLYSWITHEFHVYLTFLEINVGSSRLDQQLSRAGVADLVSASWTAAGEQGSCETLLLDDG